MPTDPPTTFQPKALDKKGMRHPLTPGMRSMDLEAAEAARRHEAELDERFDLLSPRSLGRMRLYVICAVICVPLVNWALTPLGFGTLWVQIPVAAAYGAVMAAFRIYGVWAAFALLATGLLTLALTGYSGWASPLPPWTFGKVIFYLSYFGVGYAVGIGENLKRGDGD